ncbi:MAG: LysM peptidoglycan-binding domain-containing protein [candidate division WOR-3 bacterium]|nr:LysM peptidoglycan-binding domain-containing protein [candidate division WOR-3 bacterium]
MKTKTLLISLLMVLLAVSVFAQDNVLTEEEALEEIEMQTARLEEAQMKLDECKPVMEELEARYNELLAQRDELKAELENLKATRGWYTVKRGDWLSKLAEYPQVYGRGKWARWPEIYRANKKLIKDPNLILPKWKLKIPRP